MSALRLVEPGREILRVTPAGDILMRSDAGTMVRVDLTPRHREELVRVARGGG